MEQIRHYEINQKLLSKAKYAAINTVYGTMNVELKGDEAPQTVTNFINLVMNGFYDGLTFHRVIPNFVAQGGCPYGTGRGGPGWAIKCECVGQKSKHKRGSISMAHAGRDTGGSQFFICFAEQPHLDGVHTIFGELCDKESFVVLDQIKQNDKIISINIKDKI